MSFILFKTRFTVFPSVICWRAAVSCVLIKKANSLELLKNHESFPILVFEGILSIETLFSNFYIIIDSVSPGSCARGSIVVDELRRIWALPSPQIPESIIHNEFWTRHNWNNIYKSFMFYIRHPCPFYL